MRQETRQIQTAGPLDLREELQRWFGFSSFRLGQEEIIRRVLSGENLLVVMPTGSGKSLCYQLPALLLPHLTVVISPLIALMKDQVDALSERLPQAATFINSSIPLEEQAGRLRATLAGQYKMLYVAPERLRLASFARALAQATVSLFVVDEAHCISEWGHDFRPDYLYLREMIPRLNHPPVLALTATATPDVQSDIIHQLNVPGMARLITGFNRPNLSFEVRYAPDEKAKLRHLKRLLEEIPGCGIIYTGTRRETEEVADFAAAVGHRRAVFYHAGLPPEQRTQVQEAFMGGQVEIVVATNAFGMGVDKADLRFVIHYALPGTVEAYYQEAGRAGRDGDLARCFLLYSPSDRALQEFLIDNDAPTVEELREMLRHIRQACFDRTAVIASETLEQLTGLRDVQIRVGIKYLEEMGVLTHLGDAAEGMTLELHTFEVAEEQARENIEAIQRRRALKHRKLGAMIRYAETSGCRRQFILNYFGDTSAPEAWGLCCDNHVTTPAAHEEDPNPEASRVAQTILRCVTQPRYGLGKGRLIGVLKGSQSKKIGKDLQKLDTFGALSRFTGDALATMIDQLLTEGYLKPVGGEYPVLALTPLGRQALEQNLPVPLQLPTQSMKAAAGPLSTPWTAAEGGTKAGPTSPPTGAKGESKGLPAEGSPLPETIQETYRLYVAGYDLQGIAQVRGLTEGTIGQHLAILIGAGLVRLEDFVSAERQARIRAVLEQPGMDTLRQVKAALGEEFSYTDIRMVAEDRRRRLQVAQSLADTAPPAPPAALSAPSPVSPPPSTELGLESCKPDDIEEFLARDRPMPLFGAWEAGWALAFNARFHGNRWQRTETGEWVYRLKYRGQREYAERLGQRMAELLRRTPELNACDFMVPIPPSLQERTFDPVTELVLVLSRHSGMPVSLGILTRTRQVAPQKEMESQAQKEANVRGLFRVLCPARLRDRKILVVDDFFDSGATLNECARTLAAAGARSICVLTASKTIHHG